MSRCTSVRAAKPSASTTNAKGLVVRLGRLRGLVGPREYFVRLLRYRMLVCDEIWFQSSSVFINIIEDHSLDHDSFITHKNELVLKNLSSGVAEVGGNHRVCEGSQSTRLLKNLTCDRRLGPITGLFKDAPFLLAVLQIKRKNLTQ